MSILIKGKVSGKEMDVDSKNRALTNLPLDSKDAGFANLSCVSDEGSQTGERLVRNLQTSEDRRLRVGIDNLMFQEIFPNSVLNSSVWSAPTATQTIVQTPGMVTLNAGGSTATGTWSQLRTYRHFAMIGTFTKWGEMKIQFPVAPQVNNVCEWGFGIASTNADPVDGVFFRLNAAGEATAVSNYNGSEVITPIPNFTSLVPVNTVCTFSIGMTESMVTYRINDIVVARISAQNSVGVPTICQEMPFFFRCINTGVTAQAQQIKLHLAAVIMGDMNSGRDWPTVMAGMGAAGYQYPTGSTTQGATAKWALNTAAVAGTLSNTAAGPGTGLGGYFLATAASLALNTDYIVSSFQAPLGSSSQPGKLLYIKGIKISTTLLGAAVVTSAMVLAHSLAFGHTAIALNTTESATSKAPRILPLGNQTFLVGAAIGTTATDIVVNLSTPVIIQPGEFVQNIFRLLSYTTAAMTLHFTITVDAYWE